MSYTEADRPDCKTGCGKKAALNKGELAYKGFCSRCYKEDVDARRRAKQGGPVLDAGGAPRGGPTVDDGVEPGEAGPAASVQDVGPGDGPAGPAGPEPAAPRRPLKCGWCIDGNHHARKQEPAPEDAPLTWRPRPATAGCVKRQFYKDGTPKAMRCDCPCE